MCTPFSKRSALLERWPSMIYRAAQLITVVWVLMIAFGSELARAVPVVCIPAAAGVPALSGPPNWLNSALGEPGYWPRLDDPRWRGATARSLGGSGASEHVSFRALRDASALYLSWYVKVAPQLSPAEALYVAFSPGGSAPDLFLALFPNNVSGPLITEINVAPPSPSSNQAALRTGAGGTWVSQAAVPTWVNANARVSRDISAQTWAINMKVPIAAAYNDGINLSSAFKMWYEVDVMPAGGSLSQHINDANITHDYIWVQTETSSAGWEEFNRTLVSTDPMVCARDVSLAVADVGTKYVDSGGVARPNRISLTGTNTFFAHPKNETAVSILAGQICAQFRIANWGTQPDWNDVPNPTTSLWKLISASCPVGPTNPGSIAAGAKADIATGATANEIAFPRTWTTAERCEFTGQSGVPASQAPDGVAIPGSASCPNPTPTRRLHACMLVELSGGGLTYTPASVYRNMDFVNASTFTREAEVSVAGLQALGATQRDVYLYVKTYNLPEDTSAPPQRDALRDLSRADEIISRKRDDRQPPAPPKLPPVGEDFDRLNQIYPTYIVYAYHDTGRTTVRHGTTYKVLRPQGSFGYYVHHEGETSGWRHALDGAREIAPNLYLVAVPEGGKTDIRTTVEARGPRKYALWLAFGSTFPHGSFSNASKSGFAGNLGLEYPLSQTTAIEGTIGPHQFKGKNGGPDIDVTQYGVNGKWYFAVPLKPFVTAGLSGYSFDPGSNRFGVNAGVGLQVSIAPRWSVEGRYTVHAVSNNSPNSRYSTLQAGLRYAF